MCNHQSKKRPAGLRGRTGSSLSDGAAHAKDHLAWSRRDFLTGVSAAVGGTFLIGGTPVSAFGRSRLFEKLQKIESNRILVLVQLNGGNDGLNTVIPVENDDYYNTRPGLAIPKTSTLYIDENTGLHPSMSGLEPVFGDGKMGIIHSVGYPSPDLSHFRSTDIWVSGSAADDVWSTGWPARYLDKAYPNFETDPPEKPLAVQIGGLSSMIFQGPSNYMGMSLASLDLFGQLAQNGAVYNEESVPETTYGTEMEFVRSVANDSYRYAEAIQDAATNGSNSLEYPANNPLASNMAVVAQLIRGSLESKIYVVSLGGFDTHANQAGNHATLLQYVGDAVAAFLDDLDNAGMSEDVLVMTFSEFGRRVNENGSLGTDHGTAAPLFLFGGGIQGGTYGGLPDLADLDANSNLIFETDFRSVYSTVLRDWFGLSEQDSAEIFGDSFPVINFVSDPAVPTGTDDQEFPEAFVLSQNYPNPFNPITTISYSLAVDSRVSLKVYDIQGRLVSNLVDRLQPPGTYSYPFDGSYLPSGSYLYRLETSKGVSTKKMVLVK